MSGRATPFWPGDSPSVSTNVRDASYGFRLKTILLLPALAAALLPLRAAGFSIVDVVTDDFEYGQNAEPSIAVNPDNPQQAFLTAFDEIFKPSPIFFTSNGGANWSVFARTTTFDATLAWASGGAPYLAHLNGEEKSGIVVRKATGPFGPTGTFAVLPGASYLPNDVPDQPWIQAARVNGVDHLYVAVNDLSQRSGKTATVHFSLDNGVTWRRTVIERFVPPIGQDGPPVRIAVAGNTVYAAFLNGSDFTADGVRGDVVVVKDTAAGMHGFGDLGGGPGVLAAAGRVFPQVPIGQERIGSDLSISVDPTNADHVYVAFAVADADGSPVVQVVASKDGGVSWNQIHETRARAALPAIAVAANGTVGLMYTAFLYLKFETHFVQTTDDFQNRRDQTLSRFVDGSLTVDFDPYIGDYEMLVATGNRFHAAFSASNDVSLWPQPPTFLRSAALLGKRVPFSIDPYYFTDAAITSAPVAPAPPTAVDDDIVFSKVDEAFAFAALNDIDPAGDILSVKSVGSPTHGTAIKAGTGSVVYTPNRTFTGTDSFTYVVVNSLGQTSTATVRVRNPFYSLTGAFVGLVTNPTAENATRGLLSLMIGREGNFTGRIVLAGVKHVFRGEFAIDGTAVATIQLARGPITLVLSLDLATGLLSGLVSDGLFQSTVTAHRAVYARGTTSAQAGYYTFALPHDASVVLDSVPHGDGFGTVTVTANGQLRAAGVLADGTKFAQGITLTNAGAWPLYTLFYGNRGSLSGDVAFAALAGSDLGSAAVKWIKPPLPRDTRYKTGFDTTLTLAGSRYTRPAANGVRVILEPQAGLGRAQFAEGGLTANLESRFQLSPDGKFTVEAPNTNRLVVTLTPARGIFTGTFRPVGAPAAIPFSGVVVTKANAGFGFFLGSNLSGRVSLIAR